MDICIMAVYTVVEPPVDSTFVPALDLTCFPVDFACFGGLFVWEEGRHLVVDDLRDVNRPDCMNFGHCFLLREREAVACRLNESGIGSGNGTVWGVTNPCF